MGRAAPSTPYCIIARLAFGRDLRTMRVPEEWIPRVRLRGWSVVIRDTEMPGPIDTFTWAQLTEYHSNPRRDRYRDVDWWRENGA